VTPPTSPKQLVVWAVSGAVRTQEGHTKADGAAAPERRGSHTLASTGLARFRFIEPKFE